MILTEAIYTEGRARGFIKTECEIMNDKRTNSCDPCYCRKYWVKGDSSYTEVELIK